MLFSSTVFLFLFLPITLAVYTVTPARFKNLILLAASIFFYAWGEKLGLIVMFVSIILNYLIGQRVKGSKFWVTAAIALNLGMLVYFKFFAIALPAGISFFTFHALSYVLDVYRGVVLPQRNPVDFALYIALFPQLIAGPILRYHDIAAQLVNRVMSREGFAAGARRFVVGLGKKMILANTFALVADYIFGIPTSQLNFSLSWLGAIAYTLQIYFDFSGYSDMAIGLGRIFGFQFLENFNYPYVSKSITDFWHRWHISLSNWFRDYLYIPLGGNRLGNARTYFNLVTVFALCGLWHGANWTFLVWGLFHGSFLVLERGYFGQLLKKAWSPLQHFYAVFVVMIGWVVFRSPTLGDAFAFLRAMAGFGSGDGIEQHIFLYMDREKWLLFAAGVVGAVPWMKTVSMKSRSDFAYFGELLGMVVVLLASMGLLATRTHNPFIYFRF